MFRLRFLLRSLLASGITLLTFSHIPSAAAAETVVMKYGPFSRSIAVKDLETLAETDQTPAELESLLRTAKQDPDRVRRSLTSEATVDALVLDRALNNPLGEAALDRLGDAIHTPAGGANRQALRAALVLSASQDNRISLLEVIQNYPTPEVHVEVDRLADAYEQLSLVEDQVRRAADLIRVLERVW